MDVAPLVACLFAAAAFWKALEAQREAAECRAIADELAEQLTDAENDAEFWHARAQQLRNREADLEARLEDEACTPSRMNR